MSRASIHDLPRPSSLEPPPFSLPLEVLGRTRPRPQRKPSRARHWDTRSCQMSVLRLKVPLLRGSFLSLVGSFTGILKPQAAQAHVRCRLRASPFGPKAAAQGSRKFRGLSSLERARWGSLGNDAAPGRKHASSWSWSERQLSLQQNVRVSVLLQSLAGTWEHTTNDRDIRGVILVPLPTRA